MYTQYGGRTCGSADICVAVRQSRTAQLSGGEGARYAEDGTVVAVP
jgi:hypothetical protein